jgi:hypothetical protein
MRILTVVTLVCLAVAMFAPAAHAAVNVQREGSENPVVEVAKSTLYGGLAGLLLGIALSAANKGDDNGEIIRWCFVGGTVVGMGAGIYFVANRPQPTALLQFEDGKAHLAAVPPTVAPDGSMRLRLVGVRF